jgi:transcriptional regulator with XRE-family HTH domain
MDPTSSKSPRAHDIELKRWSHLVRDAMASRGRSQRDIAATIGVHKTDLGKWLNAEAVPSPWALEALASELELTAVDQMVALGWLGHPSLAVGISGELFHADSVVEFKRITNDLMKLQRRVETVARMPFALVRSVIEPPSELGPTWRKRWNAQIHSRVSGDIYPTPYGLHTEFRLNPGSVAMTRDQLHRSMLGVPILRPFVAANEDDFTIPGPGDSSYTARLKAERLELTALMSAEPLARFGIWVGEGGKAWRSLVPEVPATTAHAHIFISEEEQRSLPAAESPIRLRPSYSSLIVLGTSHLAGPRLGRLLAAALGWAHLNPAQEALETAAGLAVQSWRSPRVRNLIKSKFLSKIKSVEQGTLRDCVISLSQADICGADDVIEALNKMTGAFIVVLDPSDLAVDTHEELETDNTWAGLGVAGWNTARYINAAVTHLKQSLRGGGSEMVAIPFRPALHPGPVDINSVHAAVADELVVIAEAITRRLRVAPPALRELLGTYHDEVNRRAVSVPLHTM